MAEIDQEDVIQIMKMVKESIFDELRLETGNLKLVIKKGSETPDLYQKPERGAQEQVSSTVFEHRKGEAKDVEVPLQKPSPQPSDGEEEGFIAIKSPLLGTFYRSPKPGSPPFVKEGQYVNEDDSVCIIEVMKLFNTVKAGVRGRIVKVCADNSQMVEYQQTLFLVEEGEDGERT